MGGGELQSMARHGARWLYAVVLDESKVMCDDGADLMVRVVKAVDTERWLMGLTKNSQRSKVR